MKNAILATKDYPEDYPSDAIKILEAMEMDKSLNLVGSMSLRSQQYAGDYDGYEVVNMKGGIKKCLTDLRERFQSNIKKLRVMPNVFIGDIKAGVMDCLRVIPRTAIVHNDKIEGYNAVACRRVVDDLLKRKLIIESEAKEAYRLLKDNPTIPEFLEAKQNIKFHILRWSVAEVLANSKRLRCGNYITLEQAFHTKGITKLDVIGLVSNNRFTDFSVIYEFRCNGNVLNPEPLNIRDSLEESIIAFASEGNYFKVLKRLFALAKYLHDTKSLEALSPILNSDLGRLYHIISDIGTLITLLDEQKRIPIEIVRFEIDQFIARLSNIYTLGDYLKKDDAIVGEIRRILKMPQHKMLPALQKLYDELNNILQKYSKPIMESFRKG